MVRKGRPRFIKKVAAAAVVAVGLAWAGTAAHRQRTGPIGEAPEALVAAVVRSDWKAAAQRLNDTDVNAVSPVLRLLKAHACLAVNRSNESLDLFLSAASAEDLVRWSAWTRELGRASGSSAAHYLRADAAARLGQMKDALAAYDAALRAGPDNVMALNGRGVAHAMAGDWNSAIGDLEAACACAPAFADAYCSRGWVNIARRTGARGALEWFDKALIRSSGSGLARHGRACALIALGRYDEAQRDMSAAIAAGPGSALLARANLIAATVSINGLTPDETARGARRAGPGMSMDTRFADVQRRWDTYKDTGKGFNSVNNALNGLDPTAAARFRTEIMIPDMQRDQRLANRVFRHDRKIADWNLGPGKLLSNLTEWGGKALNAGAGLIPQPVVKAATRLFGVGAEAAGHKMNAWCDTNQKASLGRLNAYGNAGIKRTDLGPGGALASWQDAAWDDGDWPMTACYGLVYAGGTQRQGATKEAKR